MKRKRLPKLCTRCGRIYYRRNLVELWTVTNVGHRAGWIKEIAKICPQCIDQRQAQRVLAVAVIGPAARRLALPEIQEGKVLDGLKPLIPTDVAVSLPDELVIRKNGKRKHGG